MFQLAKHGVVSVPGNIYSLTETLPLVANVCQRQTVPNRQSTRENVHVLKQNRSTMGVKQEEAYSVTAYSSIPYPLLRLRTH